MRTVRLIPCLDVDSGRVVKGVGFVDLVDAGDPAELASRYDEQGADEVVLLDITASSDGRETLIDVVERTAERLSVPLTVGGGIRTLDDARRLLRAGADKVSVNTAALSKPALIGEIAATFGSQCVVVAIDARRRSGYSASSVAVSPPNAEDGVGGGVEHTWEVVTHGGRQPTGLDVLTWAVIAERLGAGELLVTSMDRDGTKSGYDIELMRRITSICRVPVIASGGVGSLDDLVAGAVEGGADALLAASIFHFGAHTIGQAKLAMAASGLTVRPSDA